MKKYRPRLLSPRILATLTALSFSPLALAQVPAASDATPGITTQRSTHPQAGTPSSRDRKSLSDTIRSIRDLRRIRPISSQGVRADVLARTLNIQTDNHDGRQIAVPWSQAMPGGSPLNDSAQQPLQLMQTLLADGRLQLIYQSWWEDGTDGKDLQRTRTEIPVTLPNGKQKPFHWVRNGKVLLSLGTDTFTITETRASFGQDFSRRHSADPQSAAAFELKQGQVVPFNQVLHEWKSGPYQRLQLMALPGERQNQFRVCFNISTILTYGLVCNTWQVPHSWNYLHTLDHIGPYLVQNGSDGPQYFRYRP